MPFTDDNSDPFIALGHSATLNFGNKNHESDDDDAISINSEVSMESKTTKEDPLHPDRLARLDVLLKGQSSVTLADQLQIYREHLAEKEKKLIELSKRTQSLQHIDFKLMSLMRSELQFNKPPELYAVLGDGFKTLISQVQREQRKTKNEFDNEKRDILTIKALTEDYKLAKVDLCPVCKVGTVKWALTCGHCYCQCCVETINQCHLCYKTPQEKENDLALISKNKRIKLYNVKR